MQENAFNLNVAEISHELRIRPEIYLKIAVSFASNLSAKLSALRNALDNSDTPEMRRILHEIKGTSGNLRLKDISEVENVMHVAVKEGSPKDELERYFNKLRIEIEKFQAWAKSVHN